MLSMVCKGYTALSVSLGDILHFSLSLHARSSNNILSLSISLLSYMLTFVIYDKVIHTYVRESKIVDMRAPIS